MATADQLLELMFSWIEQMESCAEQLKKLADELESLREKCNAAKCFGSSVSVIGAASGIGAGVLTLCTGGAAAPFLAALGGVYGTIGTAVSMGTKIIEHFLSSDTLKEAQKIEEKINRTVEKIQKKFEKLKAEVKKMYPSADPDELDRHVMAAVMAAMARRSGLKLNISFIQECFYHAKQRPLVAVMAGLTVILCGILAVFLLKTVGKQAKILIDKATKQLVKKMSSLGLKTAFKGGVMVVRGAVGLGFALHEAIGNWKDLIKNNHETEASRSMRDTADDIRKMCSTLRQQFADMRTALEEMDRIQQEEEEKARRRREEEQMDRIQREEEEKARRQRERGENTQILVLVSVLVLFICLVFSFYRGR